MSGKTRKSPEDQITVILIAVRSFLFALVNSCFEYCVKDKTGWTGLFQNVVLGSVSFLDYAGKPDKVGDNEREWSGPREGKNNAPKRGQIWFSRAIGEAPGGWSSYHEVLITIGHLVLQNVKGDSTSASKALRCSAILGMLELSRARITGLELWIEKGGKRTCEYTYDEKYINEVLLVDWRAFSESQKAYRLASPLMLALYNNDSAKATPRAAFDWNESRDL